MNRLLSGAVIACLALVDASLAVAQNAAVTVSVDAAANRRTINPQVYGLNYGTNATLNDLNAPLNRYGGNNTSRYNWQLNADNRDFDWYFQSIGDASATPGERANSFIATSKSANAEAMVTIPMLPWVAKLGPNRSKLASFSIAKYGAQTGNDWQWFPDAGNGILASTGQEIQNNDPNDANVPAGPAFQQAFVQNMVSQWGNAANGGLKYYVLDNEHSIWHSTHRDVKKTGATMEEVRQLMIDYAAMIRSVDSNAQIVGPEEWGWSAVTLSGYDQQWGSRNGWSNLPDRTAHGNMDYLPWLLNSLRQYDVANNRRSLDVFSMHWYPQSGEFGDDTSSAMQLNRNRSTRSLWDPNYTDTSWIADKVQLIPRMKGYVASYYPGLKTAITEYNWGAENHINGATAQADIYGIFGREGLDMATRWTVPASTTPTYKAMKLYRNYDGNKSTFGDTSVRATVPNPDALSAFAAQRTSDGALTVMVIGKISGSTPVTLNLANFAASGNAQVWQLTSSNAISRLADLNFSGSSLSTSVPGQSITLFVLSAGAPNAAPTAVISANPTSGVAPVAVNFSGAGSSDPDGTIASYAWTFGDGTTGTGATVSHTYAAAGSYTARLTVTDNKGATGTTTVTITATTDPNVIAAPTSLGASTAKGGKATLTWVDRSNNETGFTIERAPSGTTNFASVGQVGANVTTFSQTGLARATYLYRVRAFNTATGRTSAYSNTVTVRITK